MPDKAGAFLRASQIIAKHNGNIVRVSYNKAVDLHMLFIEIEASNEKLRNIEEDLLYIGYLNDKITETRVIEVTIEIPDKPGAVLPVLEILNSFDINISYMNSCANGDTYQNFKFGLLIENPKIIKTLLDEISKVYQINITECDCLEENLDNTVFYIRLANEMQKLFGLSTEKTIQFISESNRILQALQTEGENASKVFGYIRRFAYFVNSYRGENFKADIEKIKISDAVTMYSIQPHCGSNSYVLAASDELLLIDTGYAIYAKELMNIFKNLFPNWDSQTKRVYITHADVDHCGLLSELDNAQIIVNKKSAQSLQRQLNGLPDYRESTELHLGYSKISQIISGYKPPDVNNFKLLDSETPENHDSLIVIGKIRIGDLDFLVYEGSGGHLHGEMVYVCQKAGIVFTGDILVNVNGFSKERAEFNSLAPYLMKSVNVDSKKALEMRKQVIALVQDLANKNGKPCIICGGHGPVSELVDGKMVKANLN
jgi:glyoxylase-like metal-dependent hydrolase (beta-lactamase superfamily II)